MIRGIIRAGGKYDGTKTLSDNPPCPRCGATHVVKNGSKNGRQRWVCRTCNRSFGATFGTPMYRLRNTPTEVARTLLVVMRRGSLSAAEEITGHKHETIGRWLRAAALHAEQITEAFGAGSPLDGRGGGRFLVVCQKKSASLNDAPAATGPRWGCLSVDRATRFVVAWAFAGSEGRGSPAGGGADAATDGGAGGGIVAQ
jgi:transposase-like protein